MTPIKRPLAAAGAAVLLALSLSACGGGAPTDASKKDYCDTVNGLNDSDDLIKAITDKDYDKAADLLKDGVKEIEEVGTPEDIPDDAREGFEIQIDASKDIDGDDLEKAFKDSEDPFEVDLSKDEKKKVEAYNEYESKTCADEGGEDPASVPTELPTDVPTDGLTTDLPSGVPTDIPSIDPSELESFLSDLPTEVPSS